MIFLMGKVYNTHKNKKMKQENWYSLSLKEVLHSLKSSKFGLSAEEAEKRLKKYGKNELPQKEKFTQLDIVISQFKSPLVYILLIAALVSFVWNNLVDMGVILFAVAINAVVGFIQETKAERALEKLKQMIDHKSYVIRNGIEKEISSTDIVLGDIVVLRAGDRVPADGRILEIHEFDIDESSLTGESVPVSKLVEILDQKGISESKKNMAYMGTSVVRGRGIMVVSSTGINTKFGQIALLLKETEKEKTPLQIKLAEFSRMFGTLTLVMVVFITVIGLIRGIELKDIFVTSVAIAVAAIPEGLLVAVTVILAIGMQRILKKGSLVRKLVAAETLGSTTVICTDKTGTLTEGKMQVDHIITMVSEFSLAKEGNKRIKVIEEEKHKLDHMVAIKIGMICNNAVIENPNDELEKWIIHGDYTERALLQSGINVGFNPEKIKKDFVKIEEIPFSSERKLMATLNQESSNDYKMYVKGAPEEIINRSKYVLIEGEKRQITEDDIKLLKKKQNDLSRKGLRIISVAFRSVRNDISARFKEGNEDEIINELVFVGLIALKDPLRKEAKDTIKLAKEAGIRTIMITGDNRLTAKTIANELGMKVDNNNILDGEKLDQMSTKEFNNIVSKIKIYARVSPHHKSRIVDAWQSKGEVVAMTGDGVNDAPALKSADIGVALGSGTEVAKETADIVLLDNNFKTIITAVEQGRVIYENIRKVILYLVSDSFSEVIVIAGSLIIGLPIPLAAAQILWINLVTDGFPDVALTLEPKEPNIMKEPPRKKNEPLLNFEIKTLIIAISVVSGVLSLAVFWYVLDVTGEFQRASTIAFSILAIDSLIYVFSIRSLRHSIFAKNIFSNKYLIVAVLLGFSFQLAAIYHPFLQKVLQTVSLDLYDWSLIAFVCAVELVLIEGIKYLFILKKVDK
ncbi:cation-transporting P-type ATPase [Candidatus Parcubacteria bacterium]|nr:cation-transporting P-type ATPase [Candidatus Parcubacteria bacterium]